MATGDDCNWSITYTYTVADACGNQLAGQMYTETGGDTSDPTASATIDPAALTNVGTNGSAAAGTAFVVDAGCDITIFATDFIDASTDNCTSAGNFTIEVRDPPFGLWGPSATFNEGIGGDFLFELGCASNFNLQYSCLLYTSDAADE